MKSIEVKGTTRPTVGKSSVRETRKAGMVPCVLYGSGINQNIAIPVNEIKKAIYTPDTMLVKLDIDGTLYNTIIREIQFHPVSDEVIHADFYVVQEDKPITVSLPVQLVGSSIGVQAGGKMLQKLRKATVKGLFKNLPERVKVDVSGLDLGKTLKVGDVSYEGFVITNSPNAAICTVEIPRSLRTAKPEAK
ncbi:MAG: 50S ribosomal protein L25 [Bacteroidia bacterium]|nr:50S ribosomal protein L25 [Bacteroidia bacterium]